MLSWCQVLLIPSLPFCQRTGTGSTVVYSTQVLIVNFRMDFDTEDQILLTKYVVFHTPGCPLWWCISIIWLGLIVSEETAHNCCTGSVPFGPYGATFEVHRSSCLFYWFISLGISVIYHPVFFTEIEMYDDFVSSLFPSSSTQTMSSQVITTTTSVVDDVTL